MFEESDQASIFACMISLHLEKHGGKIDENCEWCKAFLAPPKIAPEPSTYKFIIFDVSDSQPITDIRKVKRIR